jgi:hypothetical protein
MPRYGVKYAGRKFLKIFGVSVNDGTPQIEGVCISATNSDLGSKNRDQIMTA